MKKVSRTRKKAILAELTEVAIDRLFVQRRWLADQEACVQLHCMLIRLGLLGKHGGLQATKLGEELSVKLWMVFFGQFEVESIIYMLGPLLSNRTIDRMCKEPNPNPEISTKPYVRKAFVKYLGEQCAPEPEYFKI